jgi:hypothetical protein
MILTPFDADPIVVSQCKRQNFSSNGKPLEGGYAHPSTFGSQPYSKPQTTPTFTTPYD